MMRWRSLLIGLTAAGLAIAAPRGADPADEPARPASEPVDEPARPLTTRGLENLLAFSRLFGFVRYFHPSDLAASADWNRFALDGVREVESAATPEELAVTLNRLFRPIAPAVSAFTTVGDMPSLPRSEPPDDPSRARIVAWRHAGPIPGEPGSGCRSERIHLGPPADLDSLAPLGLPDPRDPWVTDLTHGISCIVPLALYADDGGTLPRPSAQSQLLAAPRSADFTPSGNDRATRLATVVVAWNAIQQFYPYFAEVPAHWPSTLAQTLAQAAAVPDERTFLLALEHMLAELRDGQAGARCDRLPPAGQVPLQWAWVERSLVVTRCGPGAPGEVRPGDVVTALDGLPVDQVVAAAEAIVSAATPAARRLGALRELRLGPAGRTARIELEHIDGSAATVEVQLLGPGDAQTGSAELRDAPARQLSEVASGIRYCDLHGVDDDSLRALLPELVAAAAVVFDLRGGAGGCAVLEHLIDEPIGYARWQQLVVTRPDRKGISFRPSAWERRPAEPRIRGRAAFLTGAGTVGRAETIVSAATHFGLAETVGEPTGGTDGEVVSLPLPGGYEVYFTGTKALNPDGSRHHGAGLRPTIPAGRTRAGIAAGRDEVLERAIEVLREGSSRERDRSAPVDR